MEMVSSSQAAKRLGISVEKLAILEKQGLIHSIQGQKGTIFYSSSEIAKIKSRHGLTLSEEAAQVGIEIQREIAASVLYIRKVLMISGGVIAGFLLLVAIFTALFIVYPINTARWLGIVRTDINDSLTQNKQDKNVLAAQTTVSSPIQTFLQPVGKISLELVKNISPNSYAQVANVAILDANDIFVLDTGGSIIPGRPINIPQSSLLQIGSDELIANLNSQYLQGKQPGTNPGDIAIVEESSTPTLSVPTVNPVITGLTNTNLSGTAGITNANLANSSITLNTSGPLSGGGLVALGGSLTLSCPTCSDAGGLFTASSTDILTNKTIAAGSNTITGLTNTNLSGSAAITDANLATISTSGKVLGSALQISSTGGLTNNSGISLLTSCANEEVLAWNSGTTSWECSTTGASGVTLLNSLSGSLTIAGGGINAVSALGSTITITATEADTLAAVTGRGATTTTGVTFNGGVTTSTVNGLTITSNGSNTLNIASGKTLGINNSITFTGTDGTVFTLPSSTDELVGKTATQTLTNKTIAAGSNTITGLTATNLSDGDFSSKITSGSYSIDILGNAATATSATNFSGSLAGDVTGTQGVTTVGKINGAALGLTTATSGNLLIGSGTEWVTRTLSNDATISSLGVLTLKNTGTPGTYGSSSLIPVFTTDAQGRITGVVDTTISGLTVSNFSSANISQWTNNSGYITESSTDTLINKTIAAGPNTITGLTNSNLSGSAGITNANLANSSLGVTSGAGLTGGGTISLGGTGTLAVNLTTSGTTGSTASNSGLEVSSSGLTLLKGCTDGQILKYTDAGGWACAADATGASGASDIQNSSSYDATDALTNVGAAQVTITSVTITPSTITGDVYVRAKAQVLSSNATDQSLILSIEDNASCTGSTLATNTLTITAASGVVIGDFELSAIEIDPGTSSQSYSFCASTATGDSDIRIYQMFATVIDTGADLAEVYTTNDDSIESGDVVSLDASLKSGMKKSTSAYDNKVLGIVTTSPGLVIGGVDKEGVKALPIALSGRVPVKVSTMNGEIKEGDYLTTSIIPGVAMKATKAGPVIGMAMTSYDGENVGSILAFVKNGTFHENFQNSDNALLTEESSPSAELDAGSQIEKTTLAEVLSDLFKNLVEFFGQVIFHADVTFLGRPTFNKDTAGHAIIKAGDNEVIVTFEKEYAQNPVVTASINLENNIKSDEIPQYAVYDVSTKGFKIKLSNATASDLKFSWIALSTNTEAAPAVSTTSEKEQTPFPTETLTLTPSTIETLPVETTPEPASPSATITP